MRRLVAIIGAATLLALAGCGESAEEKAAREKQAAEDKANGFDCLSAWDGSNRSVVDQVKDQLRDPDSFKHVETRITPPDKSGMHTVIMRFSSKNGFGGVNQGIATAKVDAHCDASDVQVADLSSL
ncbi:MAG: hypothetical protein ACM3ZV_07490 [Bacillota bacterium]